MNPNPQRLRDGDTFLQSGVLPFRRSGGDEIEVFLITSRRTGLWQFPKGYLEPEMTPAESAAKEGEEEAGVRGRTFPRPIGDYRYRRDDAEFKVEVFALEVEEVLDDFKEAGQRRRRWATVGEAIKLIDDDGLRALLRRFAEAPERFTNSAE